MKTVILSLGGSIINPGEINVKLLKEFQDLVYEYVKKDFRFVVVAGGGQLCRDYNAAAEKITKVKDVDLDWMGIRATKMNAELLRTIFSDDAYKGVIDNPTEKINTDKKIIIGSGWQPNCSTDWDAVALAENFKAEMMVNMSNVEYIYDKDPNKHKDAKPFKEMSWKELRKIVGDKWKPGLNMAFDPVAAKYAEKIGLKVVVMGADLKNFRNLLDERDFSGTVIN